MLKHRLIPTVLFAISLALTGCATKAPASCDGADRRPVNAPAHAGVVYQSCGVGVA